MATEAQIQADILLAIGSMRGIYVERRNAGAFMGMGGLVRAGVAGVADIQCVVNGRAVALECKTATGRLRTVQKRWRDAGCDAGGFYAVGRSPHEALKAIRQVRDASQPDASG